MEDTEISTWWTEQRRLAIIQETEILLDFLKKVEKPTYNQVDKLINKIHTVIDSDKYSE